MLSCVMFMTHKPAFRVKKFDLDPVESYFQTLNNPYRSSQKLMFKSQDFRIREKSSRQT